MTKVRELLDYGYFSEHLPRTFTTKDLLQNLNDIISSVGYNKIPVTTPTVFSLYKDGVNRREISVPNIYSFLACAKFVDDEWQFLIQYTNSKSSHSPILDIDSYDQAINSPALIDKSNKSSKFKVSLEDNIDISMGYLFKLTIDINNFYNSIYTHIITWAVCGKEEAKKVLYKQPVDINTTNDYDKADRFDRLIRGMKGNETNGIITGPFTSRIFSEIILCKLDQELRAKEYVFYRYVDDFSIYFRNRHEAESAIMDIQQILSKYNLHVNFSKVKIEEFPFNIMRDIKDEFKRKEDSGGILAVLNHSLFLYENGEKGAVRYALKMIKDKELQDPRQINSVFSILINMLFSFPRNGNEIIDFIVKNKRWFYKVRLDRVLNNEVKRCVQENKMHETILYIELLRKLEIVLTMENFKLILKSKNDLAIIILLYLHSEGEKYLGSEKSVRESSIESLINELQGEEYFGNRWLLLYEIKNRRDIKNKGELFKFEAKNDALVSFFKRLSKKKISFYHPD